MTDKEVAQLRSYFSTREVEEKEENILSAKEQGSMDKEEAGEAILTLRKTAFIQGRKHYKEETGNWPIKVPVYERCVWEKD